MLTATTDTMIQVEFGISGPNLEEAVAAVRIALINRALEKHGYNKSKAAAWLRINRTTLLGQMKLLQIPGSPGGSNGTTDEAG